MVEMVHTRVTGGATESALQVRCASAFGHAAGKLMERLARFRSGVRADGRSA